MKCEAPRAPRSSPAHLVYKFGGAVQEILNLATQLDAKTLSDKRTARLRERMHDLDCALWPEEPHDDAQLADATKEGELGKIYRSRLFYQIRFLRHWLPARRHTDKVRTRVKQSII